MNLSILEFSYIGVCVEGFLFGLYSGIFALYCYVRAKSTDSTKKSGTNNIVFYGLCTLYVGTFITLVFDIQNIAIEQQFIDISANASFRVFITSSIIDACCDFISQSVLIYRCWIVWSNSIRVIFIPTILSFLFLATWLTSIGSTYVSQGILNNRPWGGPVLLTSIILSMTVNALVTGLILFKIWKVFQAVKTTTSERPGLGSAGGKQLRTTIFIIIESGMALFSIQVARVVVTILTSNAALNAFLVIVGINEMLNGITPTIILVRVSLGLSFHDDKSFVEATESLTGDLRFVSPSDSDSILGRDHIDGVQEERDDIGSDDIQMVDR